MLDRGAAGAGAGAGDPKSGIRDSRVCGCRILNSRVTIQPAAPASPPSVDLGRSGGHLWRVRRTTDRRAARGARARRSVLDRAAIHRLDGCRRELSGALARYDERVVSVSADSAQRGQRDRRRWRNRAPAHRRFESDVRRSAGGARFGGQRVRRRADRRKCANGRERDARPRRWPRCSRRNWPASSRPAGGSSVPESANSSPLGLPRLIPDTLPVARSRPSETRGMLHFSPCARACAEVPRSRRDRPAGSAPAISWRRNGRNAEALAALQKTWRPIPRTTRRVSGSPACTPAWSSDVAERCTTA